MRYVVRMGAEGGIAYMEFRSPQAVGLGVTLLEPWSKVFTRSGSDTGDESRARWRDGLDNATVLWGPYGTDLGDGATLCGLPDFLEGARDFARRGDAMAPDITLGDYRLGLLTEPFGEGLDPDTWEGILAATPEDHPLLAMPVSVWVETLLAYARNEYTPSRWGSFDKALRVYTQETWT